MWYAVVWCDVAGVYCVVLCYVVLCCIVLCVVWYAVVRSGWGGIVWYGMV